MTGEKDMFHYLQLVQETHKVVGIGNIFISNNQSLANVLLVDSLSYNLLFVSQLCRMGFDCLFTNVCMKILRRGIPLLPLQDG
jgi:hypothetical protein